MTWKKSKKKSENVKEKKQLSLQLKIQEVAGILLKKQQQVRLYKTVRFPQFIVNLNHVTFKYRLLGIFDI
jgi:hypothetical protein